MTVTVGDIVHCHSAIAGHPKYHICIKDIAGQSAAVFLFLNSKTGWRGDLTLPMGAIPCIPSAATVQSHVSFAQLIRMNTQQLTLFQAQVLGGLPAPAARLLEAHAQIVPTLTGVERKLVLDGLALIV